MAKESTCSWCGVEVAADDGFRAYQPAGERAASFCRLEHVVPWAIKGGRWPVAAIELPADVASRPQRCSDCEAELGAVDVLLVRHRGAHRIADGFCSVDHLKAWAVAGGRWR